MSQLFSRGNFFTQRQDMKSREAALTAKLRDKLRGSEVSDDLFELLVIRKELAKERCCKELDPQVAGRISELTVLIDLFNT